MTSVGLPEDRADRFTGEAQSRDGSADRVAANALSERFGSEKCAVGAVTPIGH